MLRFINGDQASWDNLAERARRACVVFSDCALPPGCAPATARVGFEINAAGAVTLLVDKGITYDGPGASIRSWLSSGELRFSILAELREWLRDELAPGYANGNRSHRPQTGTVSAPVRPAVLRPHDLTDLEAVTSRTDAHTAALLDEDDLLRELKTWVYGQDEALGVVARRVSRHVGRSQPRKPITLVAVGPTGVGKTRTSEALAKSLGALLNGRWSSFVLLRMNEYQEKHRVSQLLGAPPSYVGYGDGTQLIDRLVAQPESVVLFDEIEKAHPDIVVALMGAMETGELTSPAPSAHGHTVDCRRAIFFFTSNIDVSAAMTELDQASGPAETADTICRRHLAANGMRPELVGRIGAFLVFRPLDGRARAEIATAAVARAGAEYGLTVVRVEPEVVSKIVSRPYDELGARPDEYYIDDILGAEFARYAASGADRSVRIEGDPDLRCVAAS